MKETAPIPVPAKDPEEAKKADAKADAKPKKDDAKVPAEDELVRRGRILLLHDPHDPHDPRYAGDAWVRGAPPFALSTSFC